MRIGKLRHYFRYESLGLPTVDSDGARVDVWTDAFGRLIPTEIVPRTGRESNESDAVKSAVIGTLRVRYNATFNATKLRGVYKGVYYNIDAVVPDEHSGSEYLILRYTTGLNEG